MSSDSQKQEKKQKKSDIASIRRDVLGKLFSDLNKKYDGNYIDFAGKSNLGLKRIPIGIFPLDMISHGGIPAGMCTMIVGKEATGKTYTCLKIVASAQSTCRNCLSYIGDSGCSCGADESMFVLYVDAEDKLYDEDWMRLVGVDLSDDKLGIVRPGCGTGQVANSVISAIETGLVDLVIVDSVAHLVPKEELEKDSDDETRVGAAAKKNNEFLRGFVCASIRCARKHGRHPTLILVNQYRDNIGVYYGSKHVLPGGNGQKYVPSLILEFVSVKYEGEDKERFNFVSEAKFKVIIKKNNLGPPQGSTEFKLFLRNDGLKKKGKTDDVNWIFFMSYKKLGLLVKEGSNYVLTLDKKYHFSTQTEFKKKLYEDKAFFHLVRQECLSRGIKEFC